MPKSFMAGEPGERCYRRLTSEQRKGWLVILGFYNSTTGQTFLPPILVLSHGLLAKLYRDHEGFTAAKNSERHFVPDLCAFNDA